MEKNWIAETVLFVGNAARWLVIIAIGCAILAAILNSVMSLDWYVVGTILWVAYLAVSVLLGLGICLAVWVFAILEKGIVLGGTVGLIPAWAAGLASALLWPILAIIFLFARRTIANLIYVYIQRRDAGRAPLS